MKVVNQIRLLGEELTDEKVVEKFLVSVPKRFEAKISSLEDSKDFSQLTLTEVINAFQVQDKKRAKRLEESVEGAFHIEEESPQKFQLVQAKYDMKLAINQTISRKFAKAKEATKGSKLLWQKRKRKQKKTCLLLLVMQQMNKSKLS